MKTPKDYKHRAAQQSAPPTQAPFRCARCSALVTQEGAGTQHRNHCPRCLTSLHLDNAPGDRAAYCGGTMDAVGVWVREGGEWAILHRCRACGAIHSNRIAADDNPALLLELAAKPLAEPPFPLKTLGKMLKEYTDNEE